MSRLVYSRGAVQQIGHNLYNQKHYFMAASCRGKDEHMLKQNVIMNFKSDETQEIFKAGVEHYALVIEKERAEVGRSKIQTRKTADGAVIVRPKTELTDDEKKAISNYTETIDNLSEEIAKIGFNPESITPKDEHIIKMLARFSVEGKGYVHSKNMGGDDYERAYKKLENAARKFNTYMATCATDKKGGIVFDRPTKEAFVELQSAIVSFLTENYGIGEEGSNLASNIFKPYEWHCNASKTWAVSRLFGSVLRVDKDGKVTNANNVSGFRKFAVIFGYAVVTGQDIEQTRKALEELEKEEAKKAAEKAVREAKKAEKARKAEVLAEAEPEKIAEAAKNLAVDERAAELAAKKAATPAA